MRRIFPLSVREKNAEKMCSQCEHLHGDRCDHPVVLDKKHGIMTHLILMSDDGLTCQIFRKECMACKHYYEEQIDVDRWKEGCAIEYEKDVETDYRKYCPLFERDPEVTE